MSASLLELQRAFARVCLDPEPSAGDLDVLYGDPMRWRTYRHMVRHRLLEMAHNGLPKSVLAIGRERFERDFASFLADRAPRSRFLRDVVDELVEHALEGWASDPSLPSHARDLVCYEQAKWQAGFAPWEPGSAAPFDFEKVAVINPTVRTVAVMHRVDRDAAAPPRLASPFLLIVHRKPDDPKTYTWALNDLGGQLFAAWSAGGTCKDGVLSVSSALGRPADAAFVDGMAGVLADLIQQSIVLGSA